MKNLRCCGLVASFWLAGTAAAQDSIEALIARGEAVYDADVGCWVCHAQTGEGLLGPSLLAGPTAADIFDQLQSNPVMGVIAQEVNPTDEDLVAVALYIRQELANLPVSASLPEEFRRELAVAKSRAPAQFEFAMTDRDLAVEAVESFGSVLTDWKRRANPGSIAQSYATKVLATFDPGESKFEPQTDHTYFYENLGNSPDHPEIFVGYRPPVSTQIVVGDAATKEVIASYELSPTLRAAVHGTLMSPDGRWVYIVGARASDSAEPADASMRGSATLIKADALTLQPVAQIAIGGRLHHGQIFQDRYLLLDTFSREPDGLDVMLYDPETDQVLGGVRDEALGGRTYTSWTDGEYIYLLMQPAGYGPAGSTGFVGARKLFTGGLTTMRPYWVAKIDPKNWEVVREYPYPGFRGAWISFDAAKEHMYISASGSSTITKVSLDTGAIVWSEGTGISPYGHSLNAEETEVWTTNKGEHVGKMGRTLTVFDTSNGFPKETVFSGYSVDHVLLAPNGKEMWATSNGEGRIFVFDARTHGQIRIIDMPQHGDAHGLVFVHYDAAGVPRVVRDQGGFHGGVHPALGRALDY